MRIFLSCQQSHQKHNVPAYAFWETYFKKGIEEAKHEWLEAAQVDWAEGLVYFEGDELKRWRDRTWTQVLTTIKQQHKTRPIDLFLSYLFPHQVEPSVIQEIQALGIPCVNFFCDNVRDLTRIPASFQPFDLHWVPEYKALKLYQQAQLNYIHAPMPVWVAPAQRTSNHPERYGISFIGSRDLQREALLARVLGLGIELEIRGSGWSDRPDSVALPAQTAWQTVINQWRFLAQHGALPWYRKLQTKTLPRVSDQCLAPFVKSQPDAEEYVQILQQSLITLGINRYPSFHYPFSQPDTYSRMRDIEAPMMGACYLTEWAEGIESLYDLGTEIETYRTAEEMVEKIHMLESDSPKRHKLRIAGQQRALSDHTLAKTLERICTALNCKSTVSSI